jgi:hypothetical protein
VDKNLCLRFECVGQIRVLRGGYSEGGDGCMRMGVFVSKRVCVFNVLPLSCEVLKKRHD